MQSISQKSKTREKDRNHKSLKHNEHLKLQKLPRVMDLQQAWSLLQHTYIWYLCTAFIQVHSEGQMSTHPHSKYMVLYRAGYLQTKVSFGARFEHYFQLRRHELILWAVCRGKWNYTNVHNMELKSRTTELIHTNIWTRETGTHKEGSKLRSLKKLRKL